MMTLVSSIRDAASLVGNARGVIYDFNMFIIQASGVFIVGKSFHPSLLFASNTGT